MSEQQQPRQPRQPDPKPQPGPIVEDLTVSGGVDKITKAPVIRPKRPGTGQVDESMTPTDPREQ